MRLLAGFLLILSSIACLFLGSRSLLQYQGEQFTARAEAGDLSDVASDLIDEKTLAREREKSRSKVNMSAANKQLFLGVLLIVLSVMQISSGILTFLRRGRLLVIGFDVLSIASVGVVLLINGFELLGVIAMGLLALAMIFVMWSKPAPSK